MNRSGLYVAAALFFILGLLYLTLQSAPPGTPTGVEHSARAAELECTQAVRDRLPEGQFPFSATATYLGEGRYRLNGIVDAAATGGTARGNYECMVRYTESGAYRVDSVTIWQSH